MKKFLIASIFASLFILSSCFSNNKREELVGTWQYTSDQRLLVKVYKKGDGYLMTKYLENDPGDSVILLEDENGMYINNFGRWDVFYDKKDNTIMVLDSTFKRIK